MYTRKTEVQDMTDTGWSARASGFSTEEAEEAFYAEVRRAIRANKASGLPLVDHDEVIDQSEQWIAEEEAAKEAKGAEV